MRKILLALLSLTLLAGDTKQARLHYERNLAKRTVPLLQEVLRFPTVAGNAKAHGEQKAWLMRLGMELGFTVRDAGMVTEIELLGPEGAPVLGLVAHGDVQPVDDHWTIEPFSGAVDRGRVLGRGAADDKGPIIQALLAMKALQEHGGKLTHTVRLLVGSDEESGSSDMAAYLKEHQAPDLSLVLDADFTVTVGEKAWVGFWVDAPLVARGEGGMQPELIEAGLAPSIVPDRAVARFPVTGDAAGFEARLRKRSLPAGLRFQVQETPGTTPSQSSGLTLTVFGRAAHGGVNLEGGRNALVGLARLLEGELPRGGADDLLGFVRLVGQDLYGTALGLPKHKVFGPITVNPALFKRNEDGTYRMFINLRRTPAMEGPVLKAHLEKTVSDFNARTGAKLTTGGWWNDEPLVFDPNAKVVQRLLKAYRRGAGQSRGPVISGGGTYAKRLPNAIAFGMWFQESGPYPGHDVDEYVPVRDLHRGIHVLLEALGDLACGVPLKEPFKP
jgi:predicted dipeptidase